jgi:hypothetical protein
MSATEPSTMTSTATCAITLLSLAERIQSYARRLENLATWRDRIKRHFSAAQDGESAQGADHVLRLGQALRDSGKSYADVAFFDIAWFAESWVESIFDRDPELNQLSAKLKAVEQREGLTELEEFDPDHPDTPGDWKALNAQSHRRYEEVARIEDARLVRFLLAHGETDMADLYANDRAAYDRRREAGRLLVFGPLRDKDADIGEGDTGLTQVVKGEE